jgi:uncharacterized protein YecE (DUF72 family)
MRLYAGTSGFAYKEWIGKFYPRGMLPKEMLHYYAERFNSVEINNTFYHMPNRELLKGWSSQVPDDFLFALKAPRVITHIKRLRNAEQETGRFLESAQELGTKLGAILFQLPPNFALDAPVLERFLGPLRGASVAFEFRHRSWFNPETLALLENGGFAFSTNDEGPGDASDLASTTVWGYLRLRRPEYSDSDLAEWRDKIVGSGWEKAFVFFKHESEGAGPRMAMGFLQAVDPGDRPGCPE